MQCIKQYIMFVYLHQPQMYYIRHDAFVRDLHYLRNARSSRCVQNICQLLSPVDLFGHSGDCQMFRLCRWNAWILLSAQLHQCELVWGQVCTYRQWQQVGKCALELLLVTKRAINNAFYTIMQSYSNGNVELHPLEAYRSVSSSSLDCICLSSLRCTEVVT